MMGIDTPESRTRDLEEKKYGLAAKNFLVHHCCDTDGDYMDITLKTYKDGKVLFNTLNQKLFSKIGRSVPAENIQKILYNLFYYLKLL